VIREGRQSGHGVGQRRLPHGKTGEGGQEGKGAGGSGRGENSQPASEYHAHRERGACLIPGGVDILGSREGGRAQWVKYNVNVGKPSEG